MQLAGIASSLTRYVLGFTAGALLLAAPAGAQRIRADEPTAFSPNTVPRKAQSEQSSGMQILSAISWYLPNRLLDITDIPSIYLAAGDGNGLSLRATKFLSASWIHNDSLALGWTKRPSSIPFGVSYDEQYFGFFAAQAGNIVHDPTELGLSAHFIVLGINAGLSLGEALDALVGFVGIDLMGDDHGPVMHDYTQPEPEDWGQHPPPQNMLPPEPPLPAPKAEAPAAMPDSAETTGTTTVAPDAPPSSLPPPPY